MSDRIHYHFLSTGYALQVLERRMIRVSTLDILNDPFELMPYLRHMKREKRKRYLKVRSQIGKTYGLLCFSQTWQEPLLWSHYAEKHKGMALGFIDDPKIFNVIYDSESIRTRFELTSDQSTNENLFIDLAKTKYKKWEYEEESRMLIKLVNCIKIDNHYFTKLGNNLKLKEVRLGAKFDYKANDLEYILKLAAINLRADVMASRLQNQGYKIVPDGAMNEKIQKN